MNDNPFAKYTKKTNPFEKFKKVERRTDSELAPEVLQSATGGFLTQGRNAIMEPIGSMAGSVIGAISGIGASLPSFLGGDEKDALETLENVEGSVQAFTEPRTDEGKAVLSAIGSIAQDVGDMANVPMSYIAGFADLVATQDPESAQQTIDKIQQNGFINTSLDKVEELTGSKYMRELVARSPDLIGAIYPAAKLGSRKAILNRQRKRELMQRVESPETAGELATQRVTQQPLNEVRAQLGMPKVGPLSEPQTQKLLEAAAKTKRLETFPQAKEAIRQGFDEGVIRAIATSPNDIPALKEMIELRKNIHRDPTKYRGARPSDVLGDSVIKRVAFIQSKVKDAGKEVAEQAKKLKGQPIDFGDSVDAFMNQLSEAGVKFDANMNPIFQGSDFAGSKGSTRLIKNIINRMSEDTGKLDAYDIHRFKRMLNEWEFTGKKAEGGLTRTAENMVSNLRKSLNKDLREAYPDYGAANQKYSELRQPLDEFIKAANIKVDLDSIGAVQGIGQEMRKLLTNYKSRIPLEQGLNAIDDAAKSMGANFKDNIYLQAHFVNELDDVIGDVAKRSFKAEQQKMRLQQPTATDLAADKAAEIIDKARGINKVNQIKAIEKYLQELQNAKIY